MWIYCLDGDAAISAVLNFLGSGANGESVVTVLGECALVVIVSAGI